MDLRQFCLIFLVVSISACGLFAAPSSAANYTFQRADIAPVEFFSPPADDTVLQEILAGHPGLFTTALHGADSASGKNRDHAIPAIPESAESISIGPADSIQAAVSAAADGDTIWLDPGIYREHDIVIDRNITIRANTSLGGNRGNTIIDAEHAGRVFNVMGPFTFAIDNLALRNGSVSSADIFVPAEGGAILAGDPAGTLIITNSAFSDCQVTTLADSVEGLGGAISAYGPLSITGSSFAGCSASGEGGNNAGGAIYAGDSNTVIASSTFTNCSVSGNTGIGGAVIGIYSITSTTFERCSASGTNALGGAVALAMNITGSNFIDCSVASETGISGGGAAALGVVITDSRFINCSASGSSNVGGGAVWGSERVSGSSFSNCSVTAGDDLGMGGAITTGWISGLIPEIDRSVFTDCSVTSGGDAGGGAVAGFTMITGSTFTRCSVTGTDEAFGGAVYYGDTIADSVFTDCFASGSSIAAAGAACAFENITGSSFTRCSATSSNQAEGGAVYNGEMVARSAFTGCSASGGIIASGGAIGFLDDVSDTSFTDCSVSAGRFAPGGATANIRNITGSSFTRCSATSSEQAEGGAIYGSENIIRSTFNSCSVAGGTGALGGAVIYGNNVAGSAFTTCSAYDGGAIYFPPYMTTPAGTISSSTFSGCHASNNGGAIFTEDVDLSIGNSTTFTGSSAQNYGGSLFINGGNVVLDRISMTNSRAVSGGGGAIALTHRGSLTITSSNFERCSAPDGGAILSGNPPAIHFCRFWQNTATGTGPAIRTMGGTVHAENNWWGTNADPAPQVYGSVTTAPWLVLGITAAPYSLTIPQTSEIRTNLTFTNTGTDTSGGGIFVPNAIPNTYALVSGPGVVAPLTYGSANGAGRTTWITLQPGAANISGTVDGQTLYIALNAAQGTWTPPPTQVPNDDGWPRGGAGAPGGGSGSAATTGSSGYPLMTVTVNIGGDSKAHRATVTGTKLSELIVTGTEQHGAAASCNPPAGSTFQYFSLEPARYGTITNAVINFTVPQSWLDADRVDPQTIVLYRMTPDCWKPLPTTYLSTKDDTAFFSAQSAGFSQFAIMGTPSESVIIVPAVDRLAPAIGDIQTPAPAIPEKMPVTTQTTAPPETVPEPSAPSPLLNVILVIAAAGLLAGGGFVARRWWIDR
ncbi:MULTISPECIES: PGF-pre-PGF domain-containing protein [unclassified Methanoregula]|uniref:PGF-pre-PGF domain-containing protein n=1 Tax=unclassified Methanoregula TaxID=2649730 RepID=UPI0009D31A27|nr:MULTISPECIES: PGF-pre-PGF domain-containing protein [unclassified Methanoregula]OPX64647.1 MAG: hypothetical protein A4E33_00731 [Methanoregula sp. PtaB.Bin085]OPY36015.1 MAG: hypothetical protein A4E34_00419 [Methanoregula sp. PtaU1.Bin006]